MFEVDHRKLIVLINYSNYWMILNYFRRQVGDHYLILYLLPCPQNFIFPLWFSKESVVFLFPLHLFPEMHYMYKLYKEEVERQLGRLKPHLTLSLSAKAHSHNTTTSAAQVCDGNIWVT